MFPLIQDQDIITFKDVSFTQVEVEDIIIFQQKQIYIAHRVIYKGKDHVITKGDNSLRAERVQHHNIVGKLIKIKHKGTEIHPQLVYLTQSAIYQKEIDLIHKQLVKQDVIFVILKGLPLHLYYTKKHPSRIYADCDLLIRERDIATVISILKENGYACSSSSSFARDRNMTECTFHKIVDGITVFFDVHRYPAFLMTKSTAVNTLYPQRALQELTDIFLQTRRRIHVNGTYYFILSSALLVLYLSLHFFHHNFKGIFRLYLLQAILIKEYQANNSFIWREIQDLVRRYELQNFVYPGWYILTYYLQIAIPKSFLDEFKSVSWIVKRYTQWVIKRDSIFYDEERILAGIHRFLLVVSFSKQPLYKKVRIVLNREVFSMIVRIIYLWCTTVFNKVRSHGKHLILSMI